MINWCEYETYRNICWRFTVVRSGASVKLGVEVQCHVCDHAWENRPLCYNFRFRYTVYVTMPGKTDHFHISSYWYHVEARYSLNATVKSESRTLSVM